MLVGMIWEVSVSVPIGSIVCGADEVGINVTEGAVDTGTPVLVSVPGTRTVAVVEV